jgi:hypothetical protein
MRFASDFIVGMCYQGGGLQKSGCGVARTQIFCRSSLRCEKEIWLKWRSTTEGGRIYMTLHVRHLIHDGKTQMKYTKREVMFLFNIVTTIAFLFLPLWTSRRHLPLHPLRYYFRQLTLWKRCHHHHHHHHHHRSYQN